MDCLITPEDRIFVAGHRGMAGSAICRARKWAGYSKLLTASRAELDLEGGSARLVTLRDLQGHIPPTIDHTGADDQTDGHGSI